MSRVSIPMCNVQAVPVQVDTIPNHGHHFFGYAVSSHVAIDTDTNRFANRTYPQQQQRQSSPSPSPSPSPSHGHSPSNKLPAYQCRQNEMLSVLHEFETRPSTLVSGFIRDIEPAFDTDTSLLVPLDLISLCFKFLQHSDLATLIDTKNHDELYSLAWEATENTEYLFAEQIIAYLIRKNHKHNPETIPSSQTSAFDFANPTPKSPSQNQITQTATTPISLTRTPRTPKKTDSLSCSPSEDASSHNLMAVIQYFLGDLGASESYFARAAAMDPSCDVIMNNYAVLLLEQQRFVDAESQIENAIRAAPRCLKNRQQYAYILFSVGKLQAAARQCALMVRMSPNVESHSGYAWLLEQMGRIEESVAQYAECVRLEGTNAIWHYWYALMCLRCGRNGEAKEGLEVCLRLDAGYEGAQGHYAYALMLCGEMERAREVIMEVVEREEDGAEGRHLCMHFYAAVIMMGEGEGRSVQTAVNELEVCLEMLEGDGENGSECRNEKGCVRIDERAVRGLLSELGY